MKQYGWVCTVGVRMCAKEDMNKIEMKVCRYGAECGVCAGAGTEFQKAVYHAVAGIPRGKVVTYGVVARAIGKPKAVRAVGGALKRNPYNDISATPRVPCHRVVSQNGIGGFYGRREDPRKLELLKCEEVPMIDDVPTAEAHTMKLDMS